MHKYTNQLINETSPYLLQHAHNPVNWHPWSEDAFDLAKKENKPVLLSIGYSACHWCHVMEEESFENDLTAKIMNDLYISIKVDREERPDVDQLYMTYVQLLTGSGGWPMTVFLTPDKKPYYGGTYFPPEDRYGRPGFKKLLQLASDYYHHKKTELNENLKQIESAIGQRLAEESAGTMPTTAEWDEAIRQLSRFYEPEFGGIGNAPKFPAVQALSLFLRKYRHSAEKEYLDMVTHSLKSMGRGGIYDQLGGGFARYSVDEKWLVPHFEKMLYDNGQLAVLYLDAYQATADSFYLNIVKETLAFVGRELLSEEGGFFSSLDADSEGAEGLYYIWSKQEILDNLGKKNGEVFCSYYNVSSTGNFEGQNILNITKNLAELSGQLNMPESELDAIIKEGKKKLLSVRSNRIRPGLDDKILVSWNGLMLSAYARAYQVTRDKNYAGIIKKNLQFLQQNLFDGRKLLHTYKEGQAKYDGFLDDYANLIQGLLDAYEALFDENYLVWANNLNNYVIDHFWDTKNHGYFYTSDIQETLLKRMKDDHDQSIPSGTGVMMQNHLRLFSLTGDKKLIKISEDILAKYGRQFSKNPHGFASFLNAFDFYLQKPQEILIVYNQDDNVEPILSGIFNMYSPNKLVIARGENISHPALTPLLFQGRDRIENKPTVYICRDFVCSRPLTNIQDIRKQIFDSTPNRKK